MGPARRHLPTLRGAALAAAAAWLVPGCQPYRIEHYDRPQFYYEASDGELVDEWTAPDGTIVKFSSSSDAADAALEKQSEGSRKEVDRDGDGKPDEVVPTPIWEEHDDGTVKIGRAHV